jgi:hypothetical protein
MRAQYILFRNFDCPWHIFCVGIAQRFTCTPSRRAPKYHPARLNFRHPAHRTTNRLILTIQAPISLHISSTYGKRSHPQNIFSRAASRDQTAVKPLIFEAHLKNRKAHVIL